MIDGTFDIAVDTPKIHRRGTLSLKSNEDKIAGILSVGDVKDVRLAGTCVDKEFTLEGSGDFGELGSIEYKASGSVWGNSIDVKCETSIGVVSVFGTRIGSAAGAVTSSHEYVMAASSGDFDSLDSMMYSGLYADGS